MSRAGERSLECHPPYDILPDFTTHTCKAGSSGMWVNEGDMTIYVHTTLSDDHIWVYCITHTCKAGSSGMWVKERVGNIRMGSGITGIMVLDSITGLTQMQ